MAANTPQHPLAKLRADVIDAASSLAASFTGLERITLERPPQAEFGDYSTNAAMLLAPELGEGPRDVAGKLGAMLAERLGDGLERAEVAGPGFINLHLSDGWLIEALAGVIGQGDSFGAGVVDVAERINVEFVSANPTGPLHIGHGRHAAFGDTLVRVLELAGHEVVREFYVNDYGGQIERFAQSIAASIAGDEPPEDGYKGGYIDELASELEGCTRDDLSRRAVEIMLEGIRGTLKRFRVELDNWSWESALHEDGSVESSLAHLNERGYVYEKDGATWLRTTDLGDDKDRVLRRSNGEYTYFAADIAYHERKKLAGFDRLVDIWGADHHGYVARMKAAFEAFGGAPERLDLLIMQLVQLIEHGQRAQMSKRKGEFVTLDELIDDIGTDASRFFLLQRSHDTMIDLDLDLAREQSYDNPVYYVQYAHARISSILRNAEGAALDRVSSGEQAAPAVPLHESERELIKKLLDFPGLVASVASLRAPHKLTAYAMELASDFSAFYRDCKVIGAGKAELERFRLGLCLATGSTIRRTLALLGVEAPQRM